MITLKKQKLIFCCFCLAVSAAVIVHEYFRYKSQLNSTFHRTVRYQLSRDDDSFLFDWCRLQRSRVDWEGLVRSCRNKMTWKHREVDSINRTDVKRSFISRWEIKPQGEFSRFYIQSVTSDGRLKRTGGDSWRVYIRKGPASLAPMVVDHDDGIYEVMFLALEPGNYSSQVFLDYTLCDGYRDPPTDWFIKGNIQGREQKRDMLGYIGDDYIKAPLQEGRPVEFSIETSSHRNGIFHYIQPVPNRPDKTSLLMEMCHDDCPLLWNGFGRWINKKWKPYILQEYDDTQQLNITNRLDTLMVYGDSIGLHYHALAQIRPLCKDMFHTCDKRYMWIYDADWGGRDNKDFNQSIVLEEIKQVLTRPNMRGKQSVFLFNIGIHYSISLNFTTYRRLINNVIRMLTQRTGGHDKVNAHAHSTQALCIWRSSTAIEREHAGKYYGGDNLTEWRFHTSPRVQLFNTYATSAMCKAGIPVLDMYPLTAAWPHGTVRNDHIHYPNNVMEHAVKVLENMLSKRYLTGF